MGRVYIRKNHAFPMVLEYQIGTGPIREFSADVLPDHAEANKGFYVEVDDVFIGLYSSKDGPVFFHNEKEYFLADENYTVEVRKDSGDYTFILKYKNEIRVEIKYPPEKNVNFDNWSTEEFMDFFLWLADALNTRRKKFVEYRTLHE